MKIKDKKYLMPLIVVLLISGFFYYRMAFDVEGELFTKEIMLETNAISKVALNYNLKHKESLFLKLKVPEKKSLEKASFNTNPISAYKSERSDVITTYYIFIEKEFVNGGNNELKLSFNEILKEDLDIRLYNYRKSYDDRIVILFPDNHIFKGQKRCLSAILILFVFGIFIFLAKLLLNNIFIFPTQKIYRYIAGILLPANILLTLFNLVVPNFVVTDLDVRIVISYNYFVVFHFVFMVFSGLVICTILILKSFIKKQIKSMKDLRNQIKLARQNRASELNNFIKSVYAKRLLKACDWLLSKGYFVICVSSFMGLFVFSLFFILLEFDWFAELIASIAYLILAVGVIGKIIELMRKEIFYDEKK